MKIRFNKENIKKVLGVGVVALVLLQGSYLIYDKVVGTKEENYPILKQIDISNENIVTEMTIDGINYVAPEGYTLEILGENVHAVKRYYLVDKPEKIINKYGLEEYIVPSGYVLVEGLIYRDILELAEPIIKSDKTL